MIYLTYLGLQGDDNMKRILLIDVQLPPGKKDLNELSPEELRSLMEKYRT